MTIDSADNSKISNRTITTNRILNRTYDSKSNRITKLHRSLGFRTRCREKYPAGNNVFSSDGKFRRLEVSWVSKLIFSVYVTWRNVNRRPANDSRTTWRRESWAKPCSRGEGKKKTFVIYFITDARFIGLLPASKRPKTVRVFSRIFPRDILTAEKLRAVFLPAEQGTCPNNAQRNLDPPPSISR